MIKSTKSRRLAESFVCGCEISYFGIAPLQKAVDEYSIINQKALVAVVLTDIRSKAILAQRNREALKERILAMEKDL